MAMTSLRPTHLLATLGLVALLAAGCGIDADKASSQGTTPGSSAPGTTTTTEGSGGGGSDTDEFCSILRELEAQSGGADDLAQAVAKVRELEDAAPESVKADVATILAAYESVADLDPKDPETFAKVFAAFLDPEVEQAANGLATAAKDECGMTISLGSGGSDTTTTTEPGGTTTTEPEDPDDLSIDQIQAAIDPTYGERPWRKAINSWGITTFNGTGTVSMSGTFAAGATGKAQALTACKVVSEVVYRRPARAKWEITVSTASGTELVTRTGRSGTCNAA